ncbi:hypothetical protein [Paludisphaera soli]|uniref:hypothetical protein n=1 Tax=Paludisphaera soli TaxID=2712865 RepID=UPI0013ECFDD6|nr:hypothetical protein [Paludisphaera soli]
MKRLGIGCASIALGAVVIVAVLLAAECRRGIISGCNHDKIDIGMTLAEVEDILGTGWEETREGWLPRPPGGPVVIGDRFFRWEDRSTARVVWIAMKEGLVCATDYWEPSF